MSSEQPLRPLDQAEEVLVRALGQVTMALTHAVDAETARDGRPRLPEYTPSCSCLRPPRPLCG
ncbi:hypothetical protein [Streptomyces sp. NPDC001970]